MAEPNAFAVGVVERPVGGRRRNPFAVHLDFEGPLDHLRPRGIGLTTEVGHSECAADRVPVHARRDPADQSTVPEDRLVVVQEWLRVVEAELHEATGEAGLALCDQCLAADEAAGLVPRDPPGEPGLERGVLVGDVVTPVAVGRLPPQ